MDFSNNLKVVNIDFFPLENLLSHPDRSDQAYLCNAYSLESDYSISNVLEANSTFNRPLTSIEENQSVLLGSQTTLNPTLPENSISAVNSNLAFQPSLDPTPCNQHEQHPAIFSLNPTSLNSSNNPYHFSPDILITSCTPSFCGDYSQRIVSPSLSQHILKRESPLSLSSQLSNRLPSGPSKERANLASTAILSRLTPPYQAPLQQITLAPDAYTTTKSSASTANH